MRTWVASALLGIALFAVPASADLFTPEPVNSAPGSTANWSQQQSYCNSTCSTLVNGNGQILGLNGQVGWTVADDLFCANHGSQTNPLVGPSPLPDASPPPLGSCPVTMLPGDTNCNQVVAEVAHCTWHNGQLEQYCEAYEAAGGSNNGEKAVISLDIAATGTCAAACAAGHLGGGLVAACNSAGMVASTAQLIETLAQKSTPMAKAISAASSAMGIGMTLMNVSKNFGGLNSSGLKDAFTTGNVSNKAGGNVPNDKPSHAACMSAIMFGAMTGARYASIKSAESTQQNACSEVEQLASTAPTIGDGGVPIPENLGGGGGSTGLASGGGTGATDTADSTLRCVGAGGTVSACSGTSATSPDVAALDSSGLGQQLAPEASQIANSPLSDGGAGNAAGGAASGAGAPSDIAGAVSTVAAAAAEQSHELFDKSGSMAGGGAGGGGDSGEAPPNPMAMLASLLGQGKNSRGPAGVAGENFHGAPESQDIYHTNSPDNLFQIISGRIQKDSARVQ